MEDGDQGKKENTENTENKGPSTQPKNCWEINDTTIKAQLTTTTLSHGDN
jgi:hypothetical protein